MMKQTVCPNCGGILRAESHGWICEKCKGFISLQDGKFYEYIEKPFMPQQTNADRIRARNDHELAETIANFVSDIDNGDVRYSDDPNDWLEWLQQPAEVE